MRRSTGQRINDRVLRDALILSRGQISRLAPRDPFLFHRAIRRNRMGYMAGPATQMVGPNAVHVSIPPLEGVGFPPPAPSGGGALPNAIQMESLRITSASDLTGSTPYEYCWGLITEGGATPGALSVLYDTVHSAQFLVGASGLDATGAIGPVEETYTTLNLPAAPTLFKAGAQTFAGGLAAVRALLSNVPNPAGGQTGVVPALDPLRGVFVQGNESGTSGTSKTYTIPGSPMSPKGLSAMMAISVGTATGIPSGEVDLAAQPPMTNSYSVPALLHRIGKPPRLWPFPTIAPTNSLSLTHKAISLGAATDINIAGCLWY